MFDNVRKTLQLLTRAESKRALLVLALMVATALAEVLGVAAVLPFIGVLSQPELVHENEWLQWLYVTLGFETERRFLFFLGLGFFVVLLVSIGSKITFKWAMAKLSERIGYSLARRLVAGYLRQPYEWFLNQHSSNIGKTVLSEVEAVLAGSIKPLMEVLSKGLVALFIVGLLVIVDPLLAGAAGLGLLVAYILAYMVLRGPLKRLGQRRLAANQRRFRAISESFGGIKELKIGGLEGAALEQFKEPAREFAGMRAKSAILSGVPPLIIEAFIMGGVVLFALFAVSGPDELRSTLPILALFAFAVLRMKPALQMMYVNLGKLRFSGPALDNLHDTLESLTPETGSHLGTRRESPLKVERGIELRNIHYRYPGANTDAIKGIDISVPVGTRIGLVGSTGAGKTTIVDIVLGLLRPSAGEMCVDEAPITPDNVRAWRRTIGYVPQHIYLTDGSIRENIAFGIPPEQIDDVRIRRSASIAQLDDFVGNELREGYETLIGERGVRLSGGQRQRIGIARALYHDPAVLVLDEATSALDNRTERAVMQTLDKLAGQKTMIIIAHRLSTVQRCDQVYVLDHARVVGAGSYNSLMESNDIFRSIAEAG
ncbi:ABC transporter ATP-binding protein [Wenzhouxiangella sp. EGI_FJ10409]|uniref:ABC transporter ATP-binding protein n=1 Tax=Wenzhouxiangella sp. EGI_FJ10409 TaxID=3243767 RepID=UPI0035E1FA46